MMKRRMDEAVSRSLQTDTLRADGATVLDIYGIPCIPVTGYVIGVKSLGVEKKVLGMPEAWDEVCHQLCKAFPALVQCRNFGIGTWVKDDLDAVVFDVVIWTDDEDEAIMLADQYHQEAYYDVANEQSVYVIGDEEDDEC